MSISCRACGRKNRDVARFCDGCGTSLAGAVASAPIVELRHDTVLFCDLVGSTPLATQLDLEDVRVVYRMFREVVSRVAREHEGFLHQFLGDGAFISFGYPRTREDAEASAVRAGLALVSAIRAAKPTPSVTLTLRVGVASGTVVAGDSPETTIPEDLVVGSVPHRAVRLLQSAPPGGVVIADATRRLAGDFFEYQDCGRLELAGFPERVQAWLVIRETAVASRFEAQHQKRSSAPLLGRGDSIAQLIDAWTRARQGHGAAVVLLGDAGIGKSRLARTVCDVATKDGAQRLEFDCTPSTSHTPLYPITTTLIRATGGRDISSHVRQRRLELVLKRILGESQGAIAARYIVPLVTGEDSTPHAESPELVRERVISMLIDLMRAVGQHQPTIALLEDLPWADATTLQVAQRLCDQIHDIPLLLVVTSRTGDAAAQLTSHGADVIALAPLDDEAATGVVRHSLGGQSLSPEAVTRIVTWSEGNPLCLEELARADMDEPSGRVRSRYFADAPPAVPDRLRLVISERLDRGPELKPFIQAASVLGRDFSLRLLAELLPAQRTELPEAIARLVDLDLLIRADPDRLRFKHALIHEMVYDTLIRSDRQRLHARAAEALVGHVDGIDHAAPDVLARHLAEAARFEDAVRVLARASGATGRGAAYQESIAHCRVGLALTEKVADPRIRHELKLQLLTSLGVALCATKGYAAPEVQETYEQARNLCAEKVSPDLLFPIVRGLGTFYFVRGQFLSAAEVSSTCETLARESGRIESMIEALSFRGYTSVYRGHLADGRATLQQCVDLYKANAGHELAYPSPQDAGTAAASLLPIALWLTGDFSGAESAVSDALAHADRLGRPFDRAYVHVWIAMLRNMQRRFIDAEHHAQICVDISNEHGFTTWLLAARMHLCIALACRVPSPDAVVTLRGILAAFIRGGAEANASFFLWGTARGLRVLGETSAAAEAIAEALQRAEASGETYFLGELLLLAAQLDDSPERAGERLRRAFTLVREQGAVPLGVRIAVELGRRTGSPRVETPDDYFDDTDWGRALASASRTMIDASDDVATI